MVVTLRDGLAPRVSELMLERLAERVDVPVQRPSIGVLSPFTETEIGQVPEATRDDVAAAVDRGRAAQEPWSQTPIRERVAILTRFHDLLIERADTAMDIIQLEAGKARIPAFEEVYDTVATTRYYMKTGPGLLKRRRRAVSFPGMTTAFEYRHPLGVVGSITPWNFPFTLTISDVVPALLAGNVIVGKPDEKTPYSMLYGASLLAEAGLPEGVLQVITGRGDEIGPALVDEVDFIMFTGSTEVGRQVAKRAGERLIGMSMELGGKNAAIVMADADLRKTVRGLARAVYANGGQLCLSMERVYVDDAIRDEFTTRFVEYSRNLPMTASFDFSSTLSSMITREHMEKVEAHVADAVSAGATLLTGGKPRPDVGPLFYEPTALTAVDDAMLLCRSETFGPVVSIYGYDDLEDAIAMANDSHLGLNHSVWTGDAHQGVEVASRLEAGTVGVNDGYAATWSSYDAPMGGWKRSGIGRRHGSEGLLKYTEPQTVAVQRIGPAFAPPGGLDYPTYQRLLGKALKLLKRVPFYK
ncbi:MAG TPA: succinic semialdehyde dehydrogenase [Acidimicrobiia bacterium]|nr:succinic semialdehyde dehydrogenase [Acidimicrobiia bacterium]